MDEDLLAVFVAFMAVACLISARRWTRIAPNIFTPELVELQRDAARLRWETAKLNSPATMVQHSKNTRQLNKLEREVNDMQAAQRKRPLAVRWLPTIIAWVVRCAIVVPLHMLYGDAELVMVPHMFTSLPPPAVNVAGAPLPLVGGLRSVGPAVWFVAVQAAAVFVGNVVAPRADA